MPNWPWKYFTRNELQCKCGCGRCEMDEEFMSQFACHRGLVGVKFIVHSGYRCPTYDTQVRRKAGQKGRGWHSKGRAIDGHWENVRKAWRCSMYFWHGGIGLYLKGPRAGRFIHYDNGPERPPWTY